MADYIIRQMCPNETDLLGGFIYQTIWQNENTDNPFPISIIKDDDMIIYTEDFGQRESDCAFIAEVDGQVTGAAWARMLNGQNGQAKGYGYFDDSTPEMAIAVNAPYRRMGIATALIKSLSMSLAENGHTRLSLSVDKRNTAAKKLYEKTGFQQILENEDDYIMVKKLK